MVSLDKFTIQICRRFNPDTDTTSVSKATILKYISKLTEPDRVYFESVMLRHHPKLFNTYNDLSKCVRTNYYQKLFDKINENIDLFNSLVRRLA